MTPRISTVASQVVDDEWITFPGGELEGRRPRALCAACRDALHRVWAGPARAAGGGRGTLCFQCYRAQLARERALKAAGELDTASAGRFQVGLPFEPVNRPRLEMLRAERIAARQAMSIGPGRFTDRCRRAQIAARHALQSMAAVASPNTGALAAAAHAAELQLPESWLPFVVAR